MFWWWYTFRLLSFILIRWQNSGWLFTTSFLFTVDWICWFFESINSFLTVVGLVRSLLPLEIELDLSLEIVVFFRSSKTVPLDEESPWVLNTLTIQIPLFPPESELFRPYSEVASGCTTLVFVAFLTFSQSSWLLYPFFFILRFELVMPKKI